MVRGGACAPTPPAHSRFRPRATEGFTGEKEYGGRDSVVTGGDLRQWKDELLQVQPNTHRFWSRQSPPSFHLDRNNPTRTQGTALLANEGADFGSWAGIRLHGSGRKTVAEANGSGWRRGRAARVWRGFVGALPGGWRGGAEWARPIREA